MKKAIICLAMILILAISGCTSSTAKKAMEETRLAVTNGNYQEALTYAKMAVKEGAKDEEFLSLVDILEDYQSAKEAIDSNDPDKAKELLDSINDFKGSGMAAAIKAASESIDNLFKDAAAYEDDINEIEQDIAKERFYIAYDEAEELLKETKLTVKQRERVQDCLKQAEDGKTTKKAASSNAKAPANPASSSATSSSTQGGGKAMATKEEAVEIAREFLGISKTAKYTYDVELVQDYYYVHFEVDYGGDESDEIGCKVDALGFYAYDPAG